MIANPHPGDESRSGNRLLDAALAYAAHGWPVFPCGENKRPLVKHGLKDASTEPMVIRAWWERWPSANPAIRTGAVSGVVAIDADLHKPGAAEALAALRLPPTRINRTPRGGHHYLYQHPGVRVPNSAGKLGTGIDVRGDGGYVLMPPGRVNGAAYARVVESGEEVQPLPEHLIAALVEHERPRKVSGGSDGAKWPEGERNDRMFRLASSLRAKGLGEVAILAALRAENAERCDPPLGDDELAHIAGSAGRYERGSDAVSEPRSGPGPGEDIPEPWGDPRPLPPRGGTDSAAEYPLERLPPAIRKAAAEVARFAFVPVASPAVAGAAITALAIGKKAMVEERCGLRHHAALFFALIAATGERKSPVFRDMTRPLEQWIAQQKPGYESQRREAQANNEVIEARIAWLKNQVKRREQKEEELEKIKRDIARLLAQIRPEPAHPRMFTSDTTEQRLFQKMEQHNGAYAVLSGEGRPVFDAIMGKYSGEGRTGDAIYLAGITGDTITRDRVGSEHGPEEKAIVRPCLNVCVMVQPDKYLEAAAHASLRASGALARIWPVWLPSLVGYRLESADEPDLDNSLLADYEALILKLLSAPLKLDDHGQPFAHVATLSREAAHARREYHNVIELMLRDGGDLADTRDIASKAVSQTAKLALVLHVAADSDILREDRSVIGLDTWLNAQAIGTYHLTEAVRVQRLADEDTALDMARRVLAWISQRKLASVSSTTIMQYSPRPRPSASQAGIVLDILEEHRYIRPRDEKARRRPVYDVHPSLASLASLARVEAENEK
jgi:hypothetical protein